MSVSWRWWEIVPDASLSDQHNQLRLYTEKGPAKLFFYQKKEGYIRLIAEQEMLLWETYLPWERWKTFLDQISPFRQVSSLPPEAKKRAFEVFYEVFHLPDEVLDHSWIQVFTHGEIPLWFFPSGEGQSLWEFFLPVAEKKAPSSSSRGLLVVDSGLAWAEAEKNTLLSLFEGDVVDVRFVSSVVWEKSYRILHGITHGKDGNLLWNDTPIASLPIIGEELCFFHCCEGLPHSQSMVSHTLAMGTQHVIATVETILDDGLLLEPIVFFYRLLFQTNVRYAFHLTCLRFPPFAKAFRLVMPYKRLYTSH